jgi:hypothetical protein
MSPHITQSFWNMTFPNIELKAFAMSKWKTTQPRWRSKMHLMLWIIVSRPPLVIILNWCGGNELQRNHKIESIKCTWWINIMFPLLRWDELHLRVWSWLKNRLRQRYVRFDVECDLVRYENKVETFVGIHSRNLLGERSFGGVQKLS